jgi:hypothetical protein
VVLLVPVLLGASALSVDIGQLMWERRQVQNGADATVTKVAAACAETPTTCATAPSVALNALAGQNANDGKTDVASICGNSLAKAKSPGLALCGASTGAVIDCPSVPNSLAALPYIEVRTKTRTAQNTTGILSKFSSVVGGSAKLTTVGACSRAVWGPGSPGAAIIFPVLMSYCDWKGQTGYTGIAGSATYPSSPDYSDNALYGYQTASANPLPCFEQ